MNTLIFAARNLLSRPIRSFLTILGVAIAIGGYVALSGLTQGVQASLERGFGEQGADLTVSRKGAFNLEASAVPESLQPRIAEVEGVESVSGVMFNLTTADDTANIVVMGWPSDGWLWRQIKIIAGQTATHSDRDVVVLGESLADALHKSVGDHLALFDQELPIIGIARFQSALNQSMAIVPLPFLQQALNRPAIVTFYQVRLVRPLDAAQLQAMRNKLAEVAKGYLVYDTGELSRDLRMIGLIRSMAATVSLIVLCMALLGVTNTLSMAVNERTYEIGILAAIGWTPHRIMRAIVVESLAITTLGGVLGLGLGLIVMHLASHLPVAAGFLEPYVTSAIIIKALAGTLALGTLGALYPAWRATRAWPAEAMRRI